MPRRQEIPEELKQGPVTVAHARRFGFDRYRLREPNWRRIGHATYVWSGAPAAPHEQRITLHRRLPPGCAFSGTTAARLRGLDAGTDRAIEVTVPAGLFVRPRPQVHIRSATLKPGDVTSLHGLSLTTPLRTCLDLAHGLSLVEATEHDGATHRGRLVADDRRQNRLQRAGYQLLHYTAPDVYDRPAAILDEVRRHLEARAA